MDLPFDNGDTMIRLLVGLGNPGPEYEATRHNAGFWFIDEVADQLRRHALARAQLLRPGGARQRRRPPGLAARADDLHEPVGQVGRRAGALLQDRARTRSSSPTTSSTSCRARSSSSSAASHAGHNGLKDIHAQLGSGDYWRLRLGIGHPGVKAEVINYVLKKPSPEQRDEIEKSIEQALPGIDLLLDGDMERAMMKIHAKPPRPKPDKPEKPEPAEARDAERRPWPGAGSASPRRARHEAPAGRRRDARGRGERAPLAPRRSFAAATRTPTSPARTRRRSSSPTPSRPSSAPKRATWRGARRRSPPRWRAIAASRRRWRSRRTPAR